MSEADPLLVKHCPICRAKYGREAEFCPNDGMRLFDRVDPMVGKVIDGRFQIVEKIGAGGMASVFKVEDIHADQIRAMKILFPNLAEDPTQRVRFLREATAARSIDHENVVQVLELGETEDGLVYMVMEFLDGPTLAEVIAREPMSLERGLDIMIQIIGAIGCAHDLGIVHRDIKPDNIALVRDGVRRDVVKILDFGLARMAGDLRLTATGQVFGTPEYIAPERASGGAASATSDQYAAGILFYEILTGRPPFLGTASKVLLAHFKSTPPPPSEMRRKHDLSPEFDVVVMRMIAKLPDDRYPDAATLIAELEELKAGLSGAS